MSSMCLFVFVSCLCRWGCKDLSSTSLSAVSSQPGQGSLLVAINRLGRTLYEEWPREAFTADVSCALLLYLLYSWESADTGRLCPLMLVSLRVFSSFLVHHRWSPDVVVSYLNKHPTSGNEPDVGVWIRKSRLSGRSVSLVASSEPPEVLNRLAFTYV